VPGGPGDATSLRYRWWYGGTSQLAARRLNDALSRVRKVVMVVRSYPIRVGGPSGPLTREIEWEDVDERAGLPIGTLRERELTSKTNTLRRVGEFEPSLADFYRVPPV
jgi:adenylosuccinate synthase